MSSLRSAGPNPGVARPDDTAATVDFNALLRTIRAEFLDMPGLRLTDTQAQRLWALDRLTCAAALATLVEANVLTRMADGRVTGREHARPVTRAAAS
jgi:hypothetical protein